MNSPISGHLTDDQFAECVLDAPSAASDAHLRTCLQCRQELSRFSSSMSDFSHTALVWSESQPRVSLRAVSLSQSRHPLLVHARWVVAAALLVVAGIPVVLHGDHAAVVPADTAAVAVQSLAPDDSDAQIAQDNKLMQSVSVAIGNSDPSPFREYGLQQTRRARLRTVTDSRSE